MKQLRFVEPNFKCEVEDEKGRRSVMYFHAASEADVKKRIEDEGLTFLSCQPYDFQEWKNRAASQATKDEKRRAEQGFKYNSEIWSEIKQYLFDLSGGNCGYCETVTLVASYGDVEHYRPKKKVEEDPKHPGYYWLAYDVTNYVPCCRRCNDARAKANHFPLAEGCQRATRSEETDQEKPLLLNPFLVDDPARHLRFLGRDEKEFGKLEGITPEGKYSCILYNLNRPELVLSRRDVFNTIKDQLDLAQFRIAQWKTGAAQEKPAVLQNLLNKRQPYSLLVKTMLAQWRAQTIRKEEEERARQEAVLNDLKMLEV